jgi:ABC-2 type transport system ATP-binding protein
MVMIRLERLRKEFRDLVAVHDLDLVVPEGEVFGLIGPNGAGKTTTLRMASGLLEPTSGAAWVAGVEVHREPERAQQFIGYLSDFFSVYDELTVWEYLDYFGRAYGMTPADVPARIDEVIEQVGLEVKRDVLIHGLSRGMKQRLGIARAVIHRPRVLLLDEPAAGLDPGARMELRGLLRALNRDGSTVLISSHILTELEGFCTSIGLMEQGRLVRSGSLAAITAEARGDRLVRLAWQGDGAGAAARLSADSRVSDLAVEAAAASFRFAGDEDALAALLADLVAGGVRVVAFGEVKQTVENVYARLSSHRVM